jgi:hypothetical protein
MSGVPPRRRDPSLTPLQGQECSCSYRWRPRGSPTAC